MYLDFLPQGNVKHFPRVPSRRVFNAFFKGPAGWALEIKSWLFFLRFLEQKGALSFCSSQMAVSCKDLISSYVLSVSGVRGSEGFV
jgi:hypothetical protein